ncbi:DapH/DapD/GlmU-related protein [Aliivibrio sifiae]|uniref:Serine acetyltransferase n=1 Tax=Aliivibrio sifiae TaxID=566293 RepID=A0A2S7X5E8_9GAMM|nr:DapH/DapD/GlmU-related protein [Aliivibrio sifiae]PQJ85410.1 hypothetical protein BTO23_19005 [Aliivibrio sifiae]GLR76412.1 hypothetical protein GCM10007855_32870 [Aliivibrio sifiae]
MSFFKIIKKDFKTNKNFISRLFLLIVRLERVKVISKIIFPLRLVIINFIFNSEIPKSVVLGSGIRVPHPYNIIMHGNSNIGNNATIYQGVTLGSNEFLGNNSAPKICDYVVVGANSVIIGPITIGRNSIISACSLVSKDINENTFFKKKEYDNNIDVVKYLESR